MPYVPEESGKVMEAIVRLLREKAPWALDAAGAMGRAVEPLVGPENPPVHMVIQALNKADPMSIMGTGMPVGMALKRYDMFGNAVRVSAETGKPLAKTAKELAVDVARARMATEAARSADEMFGAVAMKNLGTGEVLVGKRYHPDIKIPDGHTGIADSSMIPSVLKGKPETVWEEGFVTPNGDFMNRRAAAKAAGKSEGTGPSGRLDFGSEDVWPWKPTRKE
jgi:hypothetical protein